jgi:prepilin-type N-terminal cleavage/methylation domain-containing protein
MRRRSPGSRARGFTLIEVMLAMSIMTFVTALLWGSFSQMGKTKLRVEKAQERTHTVRIALMRMTREIEMSFISAHDRDGVQERRTMFVGTTGGSFDKLIFSWFGHQRLRADRPEADTALVSYFSAPDPENLMVTNLMRRETRRLETKDPERIPGETYILCPDVTSVKFSYYDFRKKEWKEEWNTIGADGQQFLPTQVRITLKFLDERRQEVTFTSTARIQMTERVSYRPEAAPT